jgi:carboxyl-terminal processing protease
MRTLCEVLTVALMLACGGGPAGAEGTEDYPALGRRVVEIVHTDFFDPSRAEAWAREHGHYAVGVGDGAAFARATRRALAELRTSHTGFYTPHDAEYYALRSIFREVLPGKEAVLQDSVGADITSEGFVRVVFAGGPAGHAGLRRGDRVLRAGGKVFHPVDSFKGRAGREVVLEVRRRADGPAEEVRVTPRAVDPRQEWLEAQEKGTRTVRVRDKLVAYVPYFSGAGPQYQAALRDAFAGGLGGADALVIDFRDGWGGVNPDFLSLFDPAVPVLTQIDRQGRARPLDLVWRKKLVVLVNGGSRSGKEVAAYGIQKSRRGVLVGRRTAGAVVAGRCFLLPGPSLLYLAVADVRVDGRRLEGAGVAPGVEVGDELPFAGGRDPQLERALEIAAAGQGPS